MTTLFQQHVFDVVRGIKPGMTLTYGQVAAMLQAKGVKACAQAVGQALRRNPHPIDKPRSDGFYVPCHRVVGAAGIGGFAGARGGQAIERKCRLLNAEKITS